MAPGKASITRKWCNFFNGPSGVAIARNGDIFSSTAMGASHTNATVVKFSKDGKLFDAWGKMDVEELQLDTLHSLSNEIAENFIQFSRRGNAPGVRSSIRDRKVHQPNEG